MWEAFACRSAVAPRSTGRRVILGGGFGPEKREAKLYSSETQVFFHFLGVFFWVLALETQGSGFFLHATG